MARTAALILCATAVLLMSPVLWAGDAALAEKLFQQGRALMADGHNDEACEKFEGSMKAEPSGGAALAYGRCRQLQGKTATAWAEYRRAAALFKARGDGEREAFAREQAAELEPGLSTLSIEVGSAVSAEIRRNGVPVAPSAYGDPMPVDPGEHEITATAEGYEPWNAMVHVGPNGASVTIQVPPLTRLPVPPPGAGADSSSGSTLVIVGGVLLAVGVATGLGGAVLGGTVLSDASNAENDASLCGNPELRCTTEGYQVVQDAESRALASNVLLGVGGAAAVGGAALLVLGMLSDASEQASASEEESTSVWWSPAVTPSVAGLVVVGNF